MIEHASAPSGEHRFMASAVAMSALFAV